MFLARRSRSEEAVNEFIAVNVGWITTVSMHDERQQKGTLEQRDRVRSNVEVPAVVHEAGVFDEEGNRSVVGSIDHQLIIRGRETGEGLDLSIRHALSKQQFHFRSFRCSPRSSPPRRCSAQSSTSNRSLPPRSTHTKSPLREGLHLSVIVSLSL